VLAKLVFLHFPTRLTAITTQHHFKVALVGYFTQKGNFLKTLEAKIDFWKFLVDVMFRIKIYHTYCKMHFITLDLSITEVGAILMEQSIFYFLLIIEGTTEKVLQFTAKNWIHSTEMCKEFHFQFWLGWFSIINDLII
jgi:hypothetical protein